MTLVQAGDGTRPLSNREMRSALEQGLAPLGLDGARVLVIIPDGTRSGPVGVFFRLLCDLLGDHVAALDFLIALGTHPPMSEEAVCRHLGITPHERHTVYRHVQILNHRWDQPETFVHIGTIPKAEVEELSRGMLALDVPVAVNRLLFEYDHIIVCGPVFPHEVVGFSGGNKYFFPGVSGWDLINVTHWLGALITSYAIIGRKHTPVRAMIDRAARFIDRPKTAITYVVKENNAVGVFIGSPEAAWSAAADLSAQVDIVYLDQPVRTVLSILPPLYDDMWTGAKGMYKVEPVVADGGEVIIYAPHITEISYTHGRWLDQIGYHVRDYFVKQWDKFKHYPWGVLAHSTHLKGLGTFENGVERPRIQVTLATGIPEERCRRVNLGYRDPQTIDVEEWLERAQHDPDLLVVRRAGEVLYRLKEEGAARDVATA